MVQPASKSISVSAAVARVVAEGSPHADRLSAARGESLLQGFDLIVSLYFLYYRGDREIRAACVHTLREQSEESLMALMGPDFPPRLLHFLAQVRSHDTGIICSILDHPGCTQETLTFILERADGRLIPHLLSREDLWRSLPDLCAALLRNPHLSDEERISLSASGSVPAMEIDPPLTELDVDEERCEAESDNMTEDEQEEDFPPPDEENFSKYQLAIDMGVSEKIKMALTGDKEWRSIFLKDSNKLVNTAVLKNPRITDGEVLSVCKNKTSSEELIRIVLMNKEWMKLNIIRTALVSHPKTPPPQALRFMSSLSDKELKELSKSKSVSQVVVTAARRAMAEKAKKK